MTILVGTNGRDVIVGRAGNDLIRGRKGEDIICGGRGADIVYSGPGTGWSIVRGGWHDDVLVGGSSHDGLDGGFGDDLLVGREKGDYLDGVTGRTSSAGAGAMTAWWTVPETMSFSMPPQRLTRPHRNHTGTAFYRLDAFATHIVERNPLES